MDSDEKAMKEIITLLAMSQDVLRELMVENEVIDENLLAIYCHALIKLGTLLEQTIVSIVAYVSPCIDCGCEGTD